MTAVNTFGATGLIFRTVEGATPTSTFYTFDEAGSVGERTDATGTVTYGDVFGAFGGVDATSDPFGYGARAGYYTDHETGLILCTSRYYDPATARWLTRDPIGYLGGTNLYGYCGNGPVGAADPGGLWDVPGCEANDGVPDPGVCVDGEVTQNEEHVSSDMPQLATEPTQLGGGATFVGGESPGAAGISISLRTAAEEPQAATVSESEGATAEASPRNVASAAQYHGSSVADCEALLEAYLASPRARAPASDLRARFMLTQCLLNTKQLPQAAAVIKAAPAPPPGDQAAQALYDTLQRIEPKQALAPAASAGSVPVPSPATGK